MLLANTSSSLSTTQGTGSPLLAVPTSDTTEDASGRHTADSRSCSTSVAVGPQSTEVFPGCKGYKKHAWKLLAITAKLRCTD